MWGAVARIAPQIALVVLFAAVAERVLIPLADVMTAGSASKSDPLAAGMYAVADFRNLVLVGLFGLVVVWLARSLVEGQAGGGF